MHVLHATGKLMTSTVTISQQQQHHHHHHHHHHHFHYHYHYLLVYPESQGRLLTCNGQKEQMTSSTHALT